MGPYIKQSHFVFKGIYKERFQLVEYVTPVIGILDLVYCYR